MLLPAGQIFRRFFATVLLLSGLLAVSNVQTRLEDQRNGEAASQSLRLRAVKTLSSSPDLTMSERAQALRAQLMQDELADGNPFANLSSSEPLNEVYGKGVLSFERQTYRSPYYVDEFGYDLIRYEIVHSDHSQSQILAYIDVTRGIDTDEELGETSGSNRAEKSPVVFIVTSDSKKSHAFTFRNGLLKEHRELPPPEAEELVSQRLNSSVPYFSVSR